MALADGRAIAGGLRGLAGALERRTGRSSLSNAWTTVSTPDRVRLTDDPAGRVTVSYEAIYRSQPAVFAMANLIANQVMRLPLRVYEGDPDGEYEPVDGRDSLPSLLRAPAPGRGATHLKRAIALSLAVHGNSTFGKYRGDGPDAAPTELLKLDWPFMSAYANQGGPVSLWTSTQADGLERSLEPSEVVHTHFDPPSGAVGVSPLEALGVTISLEDAARRYQQASFKNAVRPSGALVAPKDAKLNKEERAEMRAEAQKMHGGVDNAFRLALLTGGVDFKPFSQNAQEAALIESREVNRDEVYLANGMPPTLVGDFRRATLSNVSETNRALFTIFLNPYLELIQDTLQAQLIQPEQEWAGQFVRFDLSEVLKGDPLQEAQTQVALVTAGLATRDEARRRLGFKAMGGMAGTLTANVNNQGAIDSLGDAAAPAAPEIPPVTRY